jgi:hypothetical protein
VALRGLLRRPPEPLADDAALRAVRRALSGDELDPSFRRRLRGVVVNRYIAERNAPQPRRREMGKLGRAVLYASVALALGVTVAGAVSQESIPGDPLYLLKRRIEEIRLRVAPDSVRGLVLGMVLDERVDELRGLAQDRAWGAVPRAAEDVIATGSLLEEAGLEASPAERASIALRAAAVESLVEDAPASVQAAVATAVDAAERAIR